MAVLGELLAKLPLSSSDTNLIPGSSSSSSSISSLLHISSQMNILDNYPGTDSRLTSPDLNLETGFSDPFLMPKTNASSTAAAAARDFVSELPLQTLGEVAKPRFFSSSSPAMWSVEQICGVVAVTVIVPFILVSNLLVIVSVARFKRLQMPTNYFIVSLAAVDVFVALITPFVIVVEVLPGQVTDVVLCLSPNRILMTACGVSVLTLAAIAYDRHTALVSPLKYVSVMTIRRIVLLVVLTWIYSAAIVWAPLPLGWFSQLPHRNESESGSLQQPCSFKLLHDSAHILFLGAIFGPACVAITVCYFRIYTVARHHARAIAAVENSVHHNLRMRFMLKDAKYAKTLALVIGVFLLLWTPYLICLLAEVLSSVHVSPWLWNYLTLLAVLNSGLNPWIYAFKNNEFRVAFRKILKACCSAGRQGACLRFHKHSRRQSSLSDANTVTTTTTTTTSQTRVSHGSMTPAGRLSDVSCVVSIAGEAGENVHKVINIKDSDGSGSDCSADSHPVSAPTTLGSDELFHPVSSESTDKVVSAVVSSEPKAFITDLLSLYLHHSLIQKQTDVESQNSHEDLDHSKDLSSYESGHTDHMYRPDNTDQSYSSDHTDYHSDDQGEGSENEPDPTQTDKNYHSDHTDYHSDDHGEQSVTDRVSNPECDHNYHSDHTDYHSDDHGDHSDRTSQTDHSFRIDHNDGDDQSDHCYHSDFSGHSVEGGSVHVETTYPHRTL